MKGCAECPEQDSCDLCSETKGFDPKPINASLTCECKTENYLNDNGTECLSCYKAIAGCINCENAGLCVACSA